jgi:hypothetical protein
MPSKQTKSKAKKKVAAKKKTVAKKSVVKKKTATRKVSVKKRAPKKQVKKKVIRKKATARKVAPKGSSKTIKKRAPKKQTQKRTSKKLPGKKIKINVSKSAIVKKPEEVLSGAYLEFEDFDFDENFSQDIPAQAELTPEEEYYQQANGMSHLQKTTIMYIAVFSVMFVVVGFWFVGIRNSLSHNLLQSEPMSEEEIGVRRDVQDALDDIQNELDLIGTQVQEKQDVITEVAEEAKQQIIEDKLKEDATNKLKEKIENLNLDTNTNQ